MIGIVPIDAVAPSTYNPRQADPRRLDLVELSLRKLGFVLPIYATPEGEILSGHQRHLVAARMGFTHIPVARARPMDLDERKAVNIVFNRGTNDLAPEDTPGSLTAALDAVDLARLAAAVADKPVDDPARWPCTAIAARPVAELVAANAGRWSSYAAAIAGTLEKKGVAMPLVLGPGGRVVNGIGRLERAAAAGQGTIDAVELPAAEAALADVMLNRLSMDFDLHTRYADLLRHNSFRRERRVRRGLGRGFVFAVIGGRSAAEFDIADPAQARRWKAVHGLSVLDFGAGHLTETELLRAAGVRVTPFEPYRLVNGVIDKTESQALARAFLAEIAAGRSWRSIFLASVLNSVPFAEDRTHIACLTAALAGPASRLYAVASSVSQTQWDMARGAGYLSAKERGAVAFTLDYEPGVRVGDFQDKPKVQKFHTCAEFHALFAPFWQRVQVSEASNNVQAICADPRPVDPERLAAAIRFEFDLPYPDGSRLGLAEDALSAFARRPAVAA